MARRLRLPRKYNPMAKALASPLYRQRTVPARRAHTAYIRNPPSSDLCGAFDDLRDRLPNPSPIWASFDALRYVTNATIIVMLARHGNET